MTHTKTVYVNNGQQWITSYKYQALAVTPVLFVGDNVLWRFYIQNNDHTSVDLTDYDFAFGINSDFIDSTTDVARASTADFNISGDWSQSSLSAGNICCRLDCSLSAMSAFMLADQTKIAYADLWAIKAGETPFLLTQFKVNIKNSIRK